MGNIRTSRPIYKDGFVMKFFVRKSIINYKIKVWNKDGTNQALLQEGILGNQDARELFNSTLQKFTNVKVVEN